MWAIVPKKTEKTANNPLFVSKESLHNEILDRLKTMKTHESSNMNFSVHTTSSSNTVVILACNDFEFNFDILIYFSLFPVLQHKSKARVIDVRV